jgi:hypothetical protein
MPRKRSRTETPRIGNLSAAMVDLLLLGDSVDDPFLCFDVQADQIAAAWRLYGDALRVEARRRGLPARVFAPEARSLGAR